MYGVESLRQLDSREDERRASDHPGGEKNGDGEHRQLLLGVFPVFTLLRGKERVVTREEGGIECFSLIEKNCDMGMGMQMIQ